jgi:hypothetical protein
MFCNNRGIHERMRRSIKLSNNGKWFKAVLHRLDMALYRLN